jgi:dipeptidyl aminopeptidase/acylaminoacyl peptidase
VPHVIHLDKKANVGQQTLETSQMKLIKAFSLALALLVTIPIFAQQSVLFPRAYGRLVNYGGQLSPNGENILFFQMELQKTKLILAKYDGTAPVTLVGPDENVNMFFATWSNDPRAIIINGMQRGEKFAPFLWVVDIQTGKRTNLLDQLHEPRQVYSSVSSLSFLALPVIGYTDQLPENKNKVFQLDMDHGRWITREREGNILPFGMSTCPDTLFGVKYEGGSTYLMAKKQSQWALVREMSLQSIRNDSRIVSCSKKANEFYVIDYDERNFLSLATYGLDTLQKKSTTDDKGALGRILVNRTTGEIDAYMVNYQKAVVVARSPIAQAINLAHSSQFPDEFYLQSSSENGKRYLVSGQPKDNVATTYLWEMGSSGLTKLYDSRVDLRDWQLMAKESHTFRAQDGVELVAYVIHPGKRCNNNACPMVLMVHGGPGERDSMTVDASQQWLAANGYLVVAVNFRGSRGMGKELELLGQGQWGLKMQDDLRDAAIWAINQKFADPKRIAIYGTSYGGYAALNGVLRDQDIFACGVTISGQADLAYFVEERSRRVPGTDIDLYTRVGNPGIPATRQDLLKRSPISKVEQMNRPVLAINIEGDDLATVEEMNRFAKKVDEYEKDKLFSYFVFAGNGHVFNSAPNEQLTWHLTQSFLSRCLKNTAQTVDAGVVGAATLSKIKDGLGLIK